VFQLREGRGRIRKLCWMYVYGKDIRVGSRTERGGKRERAFVVELMGRGALYPLDVSFACVNTRG
jgi:hypothetical protein